MSTNQINTKPKRKYSRAHYRRGTPEYEAWRNMKKRCYAPYDREFKNYGARGIRVCEQWLDFNVFFADMGERPSSQHSLDRIRTDGNYEPGNCQWATKTEQSSNRRTSRFLTYKGRTMTMSAWSRELGLGRSGVLLRLKQGWSVERALSTPKG